MLLSGSWLRWIVQWLASIQPHRAVYTLLPATVIEIPLRASRSDWTTERRGIRLLIVYQRSAPQICDMPLPSFICSLRNMHRDTENAHCAYSLKVSFTYLINMLDCDVFYLVRREWPVLRGTPPHIHLHKGSHIWKFTFFLWLEGGG